MSSQTLLVDFPPEVTTKVLEKLDFSGILTLRKVCHDLRNFIDDKPPKLKNTKTSVSLSSDSVSLYFKDPRIEYINFKTSENGCEMKWEHHDNGKSTSVPRLHVGFVGLDCASFNFKNSENGREMKWDHRNNDQSKIFENECFSAVLSRELEIVRKFIPILSSVSVTMNSSRKKEEIEEILKKFAKVNIFRAKKVKFDGLFMEHVAKFLPFFESKTLEKISIHDPSRGVKNSEGAEIIQDSQEISNLEQWKNAKKVKIDVYRFTPNLRDFLHFLKVEMICFTVKIEDIVLLKEKFLTSPTPSYFQITTFGYSDARVNTIFGQTSIQDDPAFKLWFFKVPNSEDVVKLTVNRTYSINFRRIKVVGCSRRCCN